MLNPPCGEISRGRQVEKRYRARAGTSPRGSYW